VPGATPHHKLNKANIRVGVTSDGKWLAVDPADMPVATAATQILALRLADVEAALPLAASEPDDAGAHVHQLRVACRRAAAALRAFRSLAPKRSRKLNRWLRRLRRAAGPARDADVLLTRLRRELEAESETGGAILDHIQQTRVKAQRELEAIDARADKGGFRRAIEKCLAAVGNDDDPRPFAEFAREQFAEAAEALTAADPHTATLDELHQLRIAAKRLRYSIELFHSAAAPALRDQAYPLVEELQDRLGALNDRAAAQERWQRWLAGMPAGATAAAVAALIVAEHAAAQQLRIEFLDWWNTERRQAFERLLADSTNRS